MEPIAMVMRRRMSEWFGHVKRRDETENTRARSLRRINQDRSSCGVIMEHQGIIGHSQ